MCDKKFSRKANLNYHIDKKVCKGVIKLIEKNKSKFLCKYCNKGFTNATNMYRHSNHTCKIKKNDDNDKNKIFKRLLKLEEDNKRLIKIELKSKKIENENKKLKRKVNIIEKSMNYNKVINNNNGTMNINNGTVNNITLVAYGSEDLSRRG